MPVIINPATGLEQEVDEATLQRMLAALRNEQTDRIFRGVSDGATGIRVWDCVDKQWTRPLPRERVFDTYLRKLVVKCGACLWTSFSGNGGRSAEEHVRLVLEQYRSHKGKRETPILMNGSVPVQMCETCGIAFSARGGQLQRHLTQVDSNGKAHEGTVDVLLIRRFNMMVSEPEVLLQQRLTGNGHAEAVPASSGATIVGEEQVRQRRRRRRSRNRHRKQDGS